MLDLLKFWKKLKFWNRGSNTLPKVRESHLFFFFFVFSHPIMTKFSVVTGTLSSPDLVTILLHALSFYVCIEGYGNYRQNHPDGFD